MSGQRSRLRRLASAGLALCLIVSGCRADEVDPEQLADAVRSSGFEQVESEDWCPNFEYCLISDQSLELSLDTMVRALDHLYDFDAPNCDVLVDDDYCSVVGTPRDARQEIVISAAPIASKDPAGPVGVVVDVIRD